MGNLPIQLTRLVGRESVLRELTVALWETRLLTLCGPGGVGKTRLAVGLADSVRPDFVSGVWWVDLSSTRDSRLVAQAFAAALLPGEPTSDLAATVSERLHESSLIVLDNCEQVIDGCADLVAGLLARSPSLRVIATSRQPLGVGGERVCRVPGLPMHGDQTDEDAATLFIARVREAGVTLDTDAPDVREAIGSICTALDGLPLALELAAARVRLLGVTQVAERLRDDTDFLRHPGRSVPERQRTLRQTLDWSHDLLSPAERALFRRLAVFRGDFSLEAVERVCADGGGSPADVLDVLGGLLDQSLVQVLDDRAEPRYRLPQTIRPYATERLIAGDDADAVANRHAAYFAELAGADHPAGSDGERGRWLDRMELEHDNLREAMNRLLERGGDDAAHLLVRLWPFLRQRGYYREARLWFALLLATAGEITASLRAEVLLGAGEVEFLQCDYAPATARLDQALALTDGERAETTRACALQRLGSIAREQGRYAQARTAHEQGLEIWTALEDRNGIAAATDYLGFVAWLQGDCAAAQALSSMALAAFRTEESLPQCVGALVNLGAAALYSGDPSPAAEHLEEALTISRRIGFQEGIAWSLHELAILSRHGRGPVAQRAQMLRDALLVHHQLGDRWRLASVLEEIVGSLLQRPAATAGAGLLGYAEQLRTQLGAPVPPVERPDRDAATDRLRGQLGPAAFDSAWSVGAEWTQDHCVEVAIQAIDQLTRNSGVQGTPILTARELAVLHLLIRGDTNREIASSLYISPSTAGVHVSNILRKLGAKRRVDAAGIAHRLSLVPAA